MMTYASKSKNRVNSTHHTTANTVPMMGSGSNSFDERMFSQMAEAHENQRPDAEREADRIAASVSPTASIEDVKSQLGQKLGADFSDIRVHTGAAAADKADSIGAKAYTQGRDVYFGSEGYDATTAAHELVHTVQQGVVAGTGVTETAPMGTVQMKSNGFFSKIKRFFSRGSKKKNPNMLKEGAFNDRFADMDNETKLDELTKLGTYIRARKELNTNEEDDFADYENTYKSVVQQASADKSFRDLMFERAASTAETFRSDLHNYDRQNYTDDIFNGNNNVTERYNNQRLAAVGYSQNARNFRSLNEMIDIGNKHFLNGNQRLDLDMHGCASDSPRAAVKSKVESGRGAWNHVTSLGDTKGDAAQLAALNNDIVSNYQLPGGPAPMRRRRRR